MSVIIAISSLLSTMLLVFAIISLWVWGNNLDFIRNSETIKYITTIVLAVLAVILLVFTIVNFIN